MKTFTILLLLFFSTACGPQYIQQALPPEGPILTKEILTRYKQLCTEYGFKFGTNEFGACMLEFTRLKTLMINNENNLNSQHIMNQNTINMQNREYRQRAVGQFLDTLNKNSQRKQNILRDAQQGPLGYRPPVIKGMDTTICNSTTIGNQTNTSCY